MKRVYGFDHQGNRLWDHDPVYLAKTKEEIGIPAAASNAKDLEVAHIILVSDGEVLKNRGCCEVEAVVLPPQ